MKRLLLFALPLATLAFCTFIRAADAAPRTKRPDSEAKVVSVTDGDTVVLLMSSKRERVRLIGIDTPESKRNSRSRKQADQNRIVIDQVVHLGKLAAEHTQKLLPVGTSVRVEFDLQPRDRYGRLLAYLWLPNGTMVNEEIIRAGYAYPLTIPPNVKYEGRFLAGFRESREKQLGLWGHR